MDGDGGVEAGNYEQLIPALSRLLEGLNPLLIAAGLSLTCLTPGPAGEAAAVAAIAFDSAKKRWFGAALSALSMIPVLGYIPAVFKVGMLLFQLSRRLKGLDELSPQIRKCPKAIGMVQLELDPFYRRIPDIWGLRGLRQRLAAIMALDMDGCSD